MFAYALTIFLGAFLLFQVQPLIGKYILPWFGGSPGVWTTCMLFFQVLLLGGYAYAHFTTRFFKARIQAIIHVILLLVALLLLPITPSDSWKPRGDGNPVTEILLLLTVCLGLPYFILSSTGPLMQQWFSRTNPGVSPYRLYALSNVGSLLALVSYPFVIEANFTRLAQASLWAWGFGAFAAFCAFCAWTLWKANPKEEPLRSAEKPVSSDDQKSPNFVWLLWLLLPACASVLLLATTNKITQDIAAIPFLWVLPLSLYLLTFVVCFDNPAWYSRRLFGMLLIPALGLVCAMANRAYDQSIFVQIGVYSGTLFVCGMICHGELYRLKPPPAYLTSFYLIIAAGGAAGGSLVAVVAPLVFDTYAELGWGLVLTCVLLVWIHAREGSAWRFRNRQWQLWPMLAAGVLLLAALLWLQDRAGRAGVLLSVRNFYGTLKVVEMFKGNPRAHNYQMHHGSIGHGIQLRDAAMADTPTTYFHEQSGVGLALTHFPRETNRRIGVVGLGIGTLCAYGRPGDVFRFYEIHPAVEPLARSHFSYLERCKAEVEVVLGDGRLSLERETSQQFDILILDAFSGGAVPVHLLTKEAFETYLRHLKPDGFIAVNIINRHLDLYPVLLGASVSFDLEVVHLEWNEAGWPWPPWMGHARWALLTRNQGFLHATRIRIAAAASPAPNQIPLEWTDDHASLWNVLLRPW